MTVTLDFGDIETREISLEQARGEEAPGLESRVRRLKAAKLFIGVPKVTLLSAEVLAKSDQLEAFVNEHSTSAFHAVQLTCSFKNDASEPFRQAWFNVALSEGTVAWSMAPLHVAHTSEVTGKISIGPKLKLIAEVELGASIGQDTKHKREDLHVAALGEGTEAPSWQFQATPQRDLLGTYHLAMVVQRPAKATVKGTLSMDATVERKALGLIPYTAALDEAPKVRRFTLGARIA